MLIVFIFFFFCSSSKSEVTSVSKIHSNQEGLSLYASPSGEVKGSCTSLSNSCRLDYLVTTVMSQHHEVSNIEVNLADGIYNLSQISTCFISVGENTRISFVSTNFHQAVLTNPTNCSFFSITNDYITVEFHGIVFRDFSHYEIVNYGENWFGNSFVLSHNEFEFSFPRGVNVVLNGVFIQNVQFFFDSWPDTLQPSQKGKVWDLQSFTILNSTVRDSVNPFYININSSTNNIQVYIANSRFFNISCLVFNLRTLIPGIELIFSILSSIFENNLCGKSIYCVGIPFVISFDGFSVYSLSFNDTSFSNNIGNTILLFVHPTNVQSIEFNNCNFTKNTDPKRIQIKKGLVLFILFTTYVPHYSVFREGDIMTAVTLTFRGCIFSDNSCTNSKGSSCVDLIHAENVDYYTQPVPNFLLKFFDSLFQNNVNFVDSLIYIDSSSLTGLLHVNGSEFIGNQVTQGDGGCLNLEISTGFHVNLEGSQFSGNSAKNGGAVLVWVVSDMLETQGSVEITNNSFVNNIASNSGGALLISDKRFNKKNNVRVIFEYNQCFHNNASCGGCLQVEGTQFFDMNFNVFKYNSAEITGGGASSWKNVGLFAKGNSYEYNSAKTCGGCVYAESSYINVDNEKCSNNEGGLAGGGYCLVENCEYDLKGDITNNRAKFGGGIVISNSEFVGKIFSTIVQKNRANIDAGGIYFNGKEFHQDINCYKNTAKIGANDLTTSPKQIIYDDSIQESFCSVDKNRFSCAFRSIKYVDGYGIIIKGDITLFSFLTNVNVMNGKTIIYEKNFQDNNLKRTVNFDYSGKLHWLRKYPIYAKVTLNGNQTVEFPLITNSLHTIMIFVYVIIGVAVCVICFTCFIFVLIFVIIYMRILKSKREVEKNKIFTNYGSINSEKYQILSSDDENSENKEVEVLLDEHHLFNGDPNGKGVIYFLKSKRTSLLPIYKKKQVVYEGFFNNGKKNGKGISYFPNDKISFEGYFQNDLREGKGMEYFDNGNRKFQGSFFEDERNGKGIEYESTGEEKFKAEWKNGQIFRIEYDDVRLRMIDLSDILKGKKTLIGKGAVSNVYKVNYQGKDYAAKVLKDEILRDFDQKMQITRRMERMLRVCTFLDHTYICKCFGWCQTEQYTGYLTELCSFSIFDFIQNKKGKIPLVSKLRILYQTAEGVRYLHANDVMHRDLKWANILLDKFMIVKITDFDLGKKDEKDFRSSAVNHSFVGTIFYSSPEILLGKDHTKKVDVYSFGIMMYELIFETVDPFEIISGKSKIRKCDVCGETFGIGVLTSHVSKCSLRPRIDENIPNIPKWVIELFQRCWKNDPKERPNFEEIVGIIKEKYGNK